MINFPVFESVKISNYALYPGADGNNGLCIDLKPGPWIVLGVNGLGKSTLLMILKYALIGPVRSRKPGFAGETSDLFALNARIFSARVGDSAKDAIVSISVSFGTLNCRIKRRLSDLKLVSAEFWDKKRQMSTADEEEYRRYLTDAMSMSRFEDAIRLLEFITFFLEDRELLIWNLDAQYELFRAVLSPEAKRLRELEAAIMSADSSARNLNANITKIIGRRNREENKHQSLSETRAMLSRTTADLETAEVYEAEVRTELEKADVFRSDARIAHKQAEREVNIAASQYEKIKYTTLRHAFAGVSASDQYVFLKILSENNCVACGNSAADAASELEHRRKTNLCLVCGNKRHDENDLVATTSALQSQASEAFIHLENFREIVAQRLSRKQEVDLHFSETEDALEKVRRRVDECRQDVQKLRRKLPEKDRASLARSEDQISILRNEVDAFKKERTDAENEIASLLENLSSAMADKRGDLEASFNQLAQAFFSEDVKLVFASRKTKFGQAGRLFEFPAFEIEMTSTATDGDFIRRTREQVSLSQQEYLDLIFRISFLKTFGLGAGSFIVDGPEGSVDAVFAEKAGGLFAELARVLEKSTVILACNVVEGDFIPETLKYFSTEERRRERLINLIELGAPTAALRTLKEKYLAKIDKILSVDTVN